jgi:hypothetical protein
VLCRSRGNTFNNKVAYVSSLTGVLKRDGTDVAFRVDIQGGVFIQVPGFHSAAVAELDVQRVRVIEVADFHGQRLSFGQTTRECVKITTISRPARPLVNQTTLANHKAKTEAN